MTIFSLQPVFRLLHRIALRGMNYGGGSHYENSGELRVLRRLKRLWSPAEPLCVIDAGANSGHYTLALAQNFSVYKKARIWALEPAAGTFLELQKNIADSPWAPAIALLNVGLGRQDEELPLYASNDSAQSGLASVYPRRLNHFGIQLEKQGSIHLVALDALCRENAIERIHFLKLDLEGHELAALDGAATLLAEQKIDVIQFEFGGCNIDSRTYFQDFYYRLTPAYTLYRILRHGLEPVTTYKEEQEIFITTNYLAIKHALAAKWTTYTVACP